MASTAQAPPPAPPPTPPRPPRSFAGPVVLIVIGVLFLLHYTFGILPWHNWGRLFAHYWPLLLILWGVVKLIEYQQASRMGMRPRGIGAGGVFLVIFIIVAGLAATEFVRWNPDLHGLCDTPDGEDLPWCGHSYNFTDDLQQAFPTGGTLHVSSDRGAINITTSDDAQVHVTVHKRIRADKEEEASQWNNSTRPQFSVSGPVVTLDANTHGAGDHWVNSDLDIALPKKASVNASTHHGDISIMGREGNAAVTSDHGDVSITDLNGSATLNLDHSSARISQVSSNVSIQGRANDVSLEDIKGSVTLDGDFMESVKLSRIAKPVSFKSSRTDMDFAKLDDSLNLDSGDLEANGVSGPLHLRTRSKDIVVNGVSGDVRLQNENGAVEIHINKPGNVEVSNRKGDIRIFMPPKAGFQVEAQVRDGEIQSDFESISVNNGDNRSMGNGSVNGGGPRIVVSNEHGDIEIRSGGMVPIPPIPPPVPKISHGGDETNPPEPREN
jgi:DUF4097 and DUF4098 domain-containing protein YvlB